jgi:ApbE superfamily uncharacterized protein (UPF0280 family)
VVRTSYPVIGQPPSFGDAAKVTVADRSLADADAENGASGTVHGRAGVEEADSGELPSRLMADTVKVYGTPLSRPDQT